MSREKELNELLRRLSSNPPNSFVELKELEKELMSVLGPAKIGKPSPKEKELVEKIRKKSQDMLYRLLDRLIEGKIELSRENEEIMIKYTKELFDVALNDQFPKEEQQKARENLKKLIDWKNGKSSQTSQSTKKDYPWGIIGSMGAVIALLLGIIVYLLAKNKKK